MTPRPVPGPGELAAPSGVQVLVWWARISPGSFSPELRMSLAADVDAVRLAKLDRFRRVEDRDRGLAAHALLRRLLVAVAGGRPSALQLRTFCVSCGKTDHGKPYLFVGEGVPRPVEMNLTHSGSVVAAALTAPGVSVGVDVEQRRSVEWAVLRRSVFADSEWALLEAAPDSERRRMNAWARKEASVKASGHGLSMSLKTVVPVDAGASGSAWSAELPGGVGSVRGQDLILDDEVAAAVGILSLVAPEVQVQPAVLE